MKQETIEKLKKLPVTHSAMAHALSYAISSGLLAIILLSLWIMNIPFQNKLPIIIFPVIAIEFLLINKWHKIAKKETAAEK
ncbi:MAG: hypothetical protein KR126chlam6_01391 [Candidatus Anoxychlamydiales bacterium]|nr:hypothetical protein [Candidatus Anoxychlamydiales bacterium]